MVSAVLQALVGGAAVASAATMQKHRVRENSEDDIWCGQIMYGKDFKTVEASWTVPNVSYPANAEKSQQYFSSQWIGIDGAGAGGKNCKGLFQAGTSVGVSVLCVGAIS